MKNRICLYCWKEFKPIKCSNFCSQKCCAYYNNHKLIDKECKICWTIFKATRWNRRKYCSVQCANISKKNSRKESKCIVCWKTYIWTWKSKYCSRKCEAYKYNHLQKENCCEWCWKKFIWNRRTKYCSDECKFKWREAHLKNTSMNKFWVNSYSKTKERKDKVNNTNMERRWKLRGFWWDAVSSLNIEFSNKLINLGHKTQLEKSLSWNWVERFYDIAIWNTLIEINPTHSHNSTIWPFDWIPKNKNYHKEKTMIAMKNWYRCIQKFDWVSDDDVIGLINQKIKLWAKKIKIDMSVDNYVYLMEHWYKLYYRWVPKKHYWKYNKKDVVVYDCWMATFIKK